MSSLPPSLKQIAFFFERLPGIGEKTANRLAFYLLRLPQNDLEAFSKSVSTLREKTKFCTECMNLTEDTLCHICQDVRRDHGVITVVEEVLDIMPFEEGDIYQGKYFVLHGRIDPLNHIGPEDIYIEKLLQKIKSNGSGVRRIKEIILATNPDMEGEATAMYIRNKIKDQSASLRIKVTRLGYGLPIGGNLEYADYMTLRKAIENRNEY